MCALPLYLAGKACEVLTLLDEDNLIPEQDFSCTLNTFFCSVFTKELDSVLPHFPAFDHPAGEDILFDCNGIMILTESLKDLFI